MRALDESNRSREGVLLTGPEDTVDYMPLNLEDAVAKVRAGEPIVRAEIPDLMRLVAEVSHAAPDKGLHCIDCKILRCASDGATVLIPLSVATHHPPQDSLRSHFCEEAYFYGATFLKPVYFVGTIFSKGAVFNRAQFLGDAQFSDTVFEHLADFSMARFSDQPNFLNARFHARAQFFGATFSGGANFYETTFRDGASFGTANVGGTLRFSHAVFSKPASLDLHEVILAPGGQIALSLDQIGRTATERLLEGEQNGESQYYLARAAGQYNMLRDNFRRQASAELEEDRCHYKYKDLLRRATTPPCRKGFRGLGRWAWYWVRHAFDWGIMKWCLGYGIYTHRILLTGGSIILFFGILYGLIFSVWGWDAFHRSGPDLGDFNPLYFSIVTFTTIGYGDFTPLGWVRYLCGFEGLLGVVLTALFTVSFARKLIGNGLSGYVCLFGTAPSIV